MVIIGDGAEARIVGDILWDAGYHHVEKMLHVLPDGSTDWFDGWGVRGLGDQKLWAAFVAKQGAGLRLESAVAKSAEILAWPNAVGDEVVELGVVIHHKVYVGHSVQLGKGCLLNTGCVVEHDCAIADHVSVAPGAILLGKVRVGLGSFIGAGAVVRQGVTIGAGCFVDAGSVVTKDMPPNTRWRHARGELSNP